MLLALCRSVAIVLALLVGGVGFSVASPAWACGCGAYVPDSPGAAVADERALIAWDGATEDIVMSMSVSGSSSSAAWVMPVPSAADVSLGDAEVFEAINDLTAPRIEYRDVWRPSFSWLLPSSSESDTAAAAPGGAVDVLGRQRLGPFDVTRLAAHDPAALAKWLSDNGFPHPDGLDQNLAPYVADNWEVVAIRLVPAEAGESLTGDLEPLRLSFASDKVVYPMRLSRSAKSTQSVDLSVLADHRMDPTAVPVSGVEPALDFAGQIEGPGIAPALADYVGDGAFLTRWKNTIFDPSQIDGDYVFEQAPSDSAYQQVIFRTRDHGDVTGLILLGVLLVGGIAATLVLGRRVLRR